MSADRIIDAAPTTCAEEDMVLLLEDGSGDESHEEGEMVHRDTERTIPKLSAPDLNWIHHPIPAMQRLDGTV
jgi:hypothetical protein